MATDKSTLLLDAARAMYFALVDARAVLKIAVQTPKAFTEHQADIIFKRIQAAVEAYHAYTAAEPDGGRDGKARSVFDFTCPRCRRRVLNLINDAGEYVCKQCIGKPAALSGSTPQGAAPSKCEQCGASVVDGLCSCCRMETSCCAPAAPPAETPTRGAVQPDGRALNPRTCRCGHDVEKHEPWGSLCRAPQCACGNFVSENAQSQDAAARPEGAQDSRDLRGHWCSQRHSRATECHGCRIVRVERERDAARPEGAHEELRRLAQAATPGPWKHERLQNVAGPLHRVTYKARGLNKGADFTIADMDGTEGNNQANAAFIAAASPATVLALLDELDALKAQTVADVTLWGDDKLKAERDAAIARAEAAERERDTLRGERDAAVKALKESNETPAAQAMAEWHELVARTVCERDNLKRDLASARLCSTCGGTPHPSGKICVCGGSGSRDREVEGLRKMLYDANERTEHARGIRRTDLGLWRDPGWRQVEEASRRLQAETAECYAHGGSCINSVVCNRQDYCMYDPNKGAR